MNCSEPTPDTPLSTMDAAARMVTHSSARFTNAGDAEPPTSAPLDPTHAHTPLDLSHADTPPDLLPADPPLDLSHAGAPLAPTHAHTPLDLSHPGAPLDPSHARAPVAHAHVGIPLNQNAEPPPNHANPLVPMGHPPEVLAVSVSPPPSVLKKRQAVQPNLINEKNTKTHPSVSTTLLRAIARLTPTV